MAILKKRSFKKRSLRKRSLRKFLKGGRPSFRINGKNYEHTPISINGEELGPNITFPEGFIFPEAELRNLDLSGCSLVGADFSKVKMLTNVSLSRAILTNANLSGCTLNNVDLDDANLSNKANLSSCIFNNCSIEKTNFSNSNLTNATLNIPTNNQNDSIQFRGTKLTGAKLLRFYCLDCNFDKAFLHMCDLTGSKMFGCSFKEANFTDATLLDVNFNDNRIVRKNSYGQQPKDKDTCNKYINDFTNAKFIRAKLTKSTLTCCIFDDADFTDAVLTKCDLSNDDAVKAQFYNTTLTDVDLTGTYLSGCDFTKATLHDVKFNNAILIGADFDNSIQTNVSGL